MSHIRFSKLLLVVLALALLAGTANANDIAAMPPANLTYTDAGTTTNTTTSAVIGGDFGPIIVGAITYNAGATGWITSAVASGTLSAGSVLITLNQAAAASMGVGSFTANIALTDETGDVGSITPVTVVITSPLTAAAPTLTSLTFVQGGGAQASTSKATVGITSADSSGTDTYTVLGTTCPAWLTWSGTNGVGVFDTIAGAADTLTFMIDITKPGGTTPQSWTTCSVSIYNGALYLAAGAGTALRTITFTSLNIQTQPLQSTTPTVALLVFNKFTNTATAATSSITINVAKGTSPAPTFYLDIATLPAWLTTTWTSPYSGTAPILPTAGNTITLSVNTAVAGGMATGNYTANVGFYIANDPDLLVTFTMQVANGSVSAIMSPAVASSLPFMIGSTVIPTPTATLSATAEPVPYTATCVVVPTVTYTGTGYGPTGCLLTSLPSPSQIVSGTAFTWGSTVTATLDPLLFNGPSVVVGDTIQVEITYSNMGVTLTPTFVEYTYTVQPGNPTLALPAPAALRPTSVSARFPVAESLVIQVTGTSFVRPRDIVGGIVVPTQVWVSYNTSATGTPTVPVNLTNFPASGSYVVVSGTQIIVTLPPGSVPTVAAGKVGTITIGVANQVTSTTLPPAAPFVSQSLNVTYSPVIYGVTSTASYTQSATPAFAPFELISIFGDNFGFTGITTNTSANGIFDANGKLETPLVLGTVPLATKPTDLSVSFTSGAHTFVAPILFANENQINALVPSGLTAGTVNPLAPSPYNLTVSAGPSGALVASDNLSVNIVPADPGIFTLASDGSGQGAIIDGDGTINGGGGGTNKAVANSTISIYLTGLGYPDSAGADTMPTIDYVVPTNCVSVANLMANVNLAVKVGSVTTYASPGWTNLDGAIMNYGSHDILTAVYPISNFAPCMASATFTVTLGTAANNIVLTGVAGSASIPYAGFVGGSIAGLYQINVTLPTANLKGSSGVALSGATPISVTITTAPTAPANPYVASTQSGVTILF